MAAFAPAVLDHLIFAYFCLPLTSGHVTTTPCPLAKALVVGCKVIPENMPGADGRAGGSKKVNASTLPGDPGAVPSLDAYTRANTFSHGRSVPLASSGRGDATGVEGVGNLAQRGSAGPADLSLPIARPKSGLTARE
jgi:hypothetical protein